MTGRRAPRRPSAAPASAPGRAGATRKGLPLLAAVLAGALALGFAPASASAGAAASSVPGAIDLGAVGVSPSATGAENFAAFQAALDAAPAEGAVLRLPPGRYDLDGGSSFLRLRNRRNVTLLGAGATVRCTAGTGFLRIDNCAFVDVSGFSIEGVFSRADHAYGGKEDNGRITTQGGSDISIHDCRWSDTAQGVFVGIGFPSARVSIHRNRFHRCFAAVQAGSGGSLSLEVSHNEFVSAPYATDDVIAVFAGPTSAVRIESNLIDRGGPHREMMAYAIDVAAGRKGSTLGNVVIAGNTIVNGLCDNVTSCRGAILVSGGAGGDRLVTGNVAITGNVIDGAVGGILADHAVENLAVSGNAIRNLSAVPGNLYGQGIGIRTISTPRSRNLVVEGNVIDNCVRGIDLTNAGNAVLAANVVTRFSAIGILVDASEGVSLAANSVSAGKGCGIRIHNSDDALLLGNRVRETGAPSLCVTGTPPARWISSGNGFESVSGPFPQ